MLEIRHQLVDCSSPRVMGIVNVTPDSFAQHCATITSSDILATCAPLLDEGADWLDIGACSTQPGATIVSEQEEIWRLDIALSAIRAAYPNVIISIDTFRSQVAEHVINKYNVDIINDISGLQEEAMLSLLSRARVPYVLTYPRKPGVAILSFFATQLDRLHQRGVNNIIIDPGFGFGKTLEENYLCLQQLSLLHQFGCPIMVGLSRKSMIYKLLESTPQEALNGTTATHMLSLMNGADILRVHDVKEAKETIQIWNKYFH